MLARMKLRALCVYCGSSPGLLPEYREAAANAGRMLAEQGIHLIYGGGRSGLMGEIADSVLAAGGQVTGVITRHLSDKEIAHPGVSELRVVESMHERKKLMSDLADGFVALPGGIGTFEEILEVFTWTQLGLHPKPCGLLNVAGFYTPLAAFLEHAVEQRFIRAEHHASLLLDEDFGSLLRRMETYEAVTVDKWIDLKNSTA